MTEFEQKLDDFSSSTVHKKSTKSTFYIAQY